MADKKHYKGTFNWHGETMVLYGWYAGEGQALSAFTRRLAKAVGVHRRTAYHYFASQSRDGYLIERVKKEKI